MTTPKTRPTGISALMKSMSSTAKPQMQSPWVQKQVEDSRYTWEDEDDLYVMGPVGEKLLSQIMAKKLPDAPTPQPPQEPPVGTLGLTRRQRCEMRIPGSTSAACCCKRYDPILEVPIELFDKLELTRDFRLAARRIVEELDLPEFCPGIQRTDFEFIIEDHTIPGARSALAPLGCTSLRWASEKAEVEKRLAVDGRVAEVKTQGHHTAHFRLRRQKRHFAAEKAGWHFKGGALSALDGVDYEVNVILLPELLRWCEEYRGTKMALEVEHARKEVEASIEKHSAALPGLIKDLASDNWVKRCSACMGLGHLGMAAKPQLDKLIRTELKDEEDDVRKAARDALQNLGISGVVSALERATEEIMLLANDDEREFVKKAAKETYERLTTPTTPPISVKVRVELIEDLAYKLSPESRVDAQNVLKRLHNANIPGMNSPAETDEKKELPLPRLHCRCGHAQVWHERPAPSIMRKNAPVEGNQLADECQPCGPVPNKRAAAAKLRLSVVAMSTKSRRPVDVDDRSFDGYSSWRQEDWYQNRPEDWYQKRPMSSSSSAPQLQKTWSQGFRLGASDGFGATARDDMSVSDMSMSASRPQHPSRQGSKLDATDGSVAGDGSAADAARELEGVNEEAIALPKPAPKRLWIASEEESVCMRGGKFVDNRAARHTQRRTPAQPLAYPMGERPSHATPSIRHYRA